MRIGGEDTQALRRLNRRVHRSARRVAEEVDEQARDSLRIEPLTLIDFALLRHNQAERRGKALVQRMLREKGLDALGLDFGRFARPHIRVRPLTRRIAENDRSLGSGERIGGTCRFRRTRRSRAASLGFPVCVAAIGVVGLNSRRNHQSAEKKVFEPGSNRLVDALVLRVVPLRPPYLASGIAGFRIDQIELDLNARVLPLAYVVEKGRQKRDLVLRKSAAGGDEHVRLSCVVVVMMRVMSGFADGGDREHRVRPLRREFTGKLELLHFVQSVHVVFR